MNRISYHKAKKERLKHYFTWEKCKHWHVSPRFVTNKRCIECHDTHRAEWKASRIFTAFMLYWGQCQNCWIWDWTLLNFHHRKGHWEERESLTQTCKSIIKAWRVQRHLYQLLCANCHIKADLRDGTNVRGKRLQHIQKKMGWFPQEKEYNIITRFIKNFLN